MEEKLVRNAMTALKDLLDLRAAENFLVVTDQATRSVGEAFQEAAGRLDASSKLYVLDEDSRPLKEVPEDLALLLPDVDVAVTCFQGRADETPFRIALIKALMKSVRRLGHGPGMTEDMLKEGPMVVDYGHLARLALRLMRRFAGAKTVRIKAPAGTDLTLDIEGREFATDAVIEDGHWGNLPAGEVWCAPVEDGASGVLVCDGSIGDLGQVPCPVRIEVQDGRIVSVTCEDRAFLEKVEQALAVDDQARVIGELGIGLNPGAKITGNLLEDEKAFETAHVAFGNNEDMPGGRNTSKTHRDFLFKRPTVVVTYTDGREETIEEDGKLLWPPLPQAVKGFSYKRILAAVDFSEPSLRALQVALALKRSHDSELEIVHVIPSMVHVSPLFPHYAAMPDPGEIRRQELEVKARMDELLDRLDARDEEPSVFVERGSPAREIVRIAEERQADLLVVASKGLSAVARMVLGSVAESVVRHAHCHVLVVR